MLKLWECEWLKVMCIWKLPILSPWGWDEGNCHFTDSMVFAKQISKVGKTSDSVIYIKKMQFFEHSNLLEKKIKGAHWSVWNLGSDLRIFFTDPFHNWDYSREILLFIFLKHLPNDVKGKRHFWLYWFLKQQPVLLLNMSHHTRNFPVYPDSRPFKSLLVGITVRQLRSSQSNLG